MHSEGRKPYCTWLTELQILLTTGTLDFTIEMYCAFN